jgi:hypothetical protein
MFAQTVGAVAVIESARPREKCAEVLEHLLALDVDDTSSSPDAAHGPGIAEQ